MLPVPRWAQSGDTETLRPPPALTPLSHVSRVTCHQPSESHGTCITFWHSYSLWDYRYVRWMFLWFSDIRSPTQGSPLPSHQILIVNFSNTSWNCYPYAQRVHQWNTSELCINVHVGAGLCDAALHSTAACSEDQIHPGTLHTPHCCS